MSDTKPIVGVVLAGGVARRMFPASPTGGDKGLIELADHTMLAHVIRRLTPQVDRIIINANGDPTRFSAFGLPVVADVNDDQSGPLSGLLAAMAWAESQGINTIATVTTDVPFLPSDFVARCKTAISSHRTMVRDGHDTAAIAVSAGQRHPTLGIWPVSLKTAIANQLANGHRSADRFAHAINAIEVLFPPRNIAGHVVDPFFNANTPEDVATARAILARKP